MHLDKTTLHVLDAGSDTIGKVYKAQDGKLMGALRKIRAWPIFNHIKADWLSVSRMIVALINIILFFFFVFSGSKPRFILLILSFTIMAYISDLLDGPWARLEMEEGKKKLDSNFGSWIDNTADKMICIPSMVFVMYLQRVYWVPIMILLIDCSLIFLRTFIAKRHKIQLRANHYGKLKTWMQGFGICFILANQIIPGMDYVGYNILKFGAILAGLASFIKHIRNAAPQIREAKRA